MKVRSTSSGVRVAAAGAVLALVATLILAPSGSVQAADPAVVGAWGRPFVEGGLDKPQCRPGGDGQLICKPTAVSVASMITGRVIYWNGIEGSENVGLTVTAQAGNIARDSQARVLSLLKGEPQFGLSTPVRGANNNNEAPNGSELPADEAFFGMLGVPGRPGDGLVGSTIGQLYQAPPVAPPDDPAHNDADMFCADLVQLADGRLLVAGGTDFYSEPGVPYDVPVIGGLGAPELEGLRNTRIYDPEKKEFHRTGAMKYGRWYPTMVTMPNGDVLVASGTTKLVKATQASQVRRTETYSLKTGKWTENYTGSASENSLPLFARLHLMPNGKVFYAGGGQMNGFGPTGWAADEALYAMQQFYNPATKAWEMVGIAPSFVRGGAFSVMLPLKAPYDKASLLVGGGTQFLPTPGTYFGSDLTEVVTVDSDDNVTTETKGNMLNRRWFTTAVVLPDGKVAAFNGADTDEVLVPGPNIPVREAELYDPATGQWSSLGLSGRDRTYHNSAILLPDGRVLVGGHSPIPLLNHAHTTLPEPFANGHKDASFELYSPPYLFRGPRPIVDYAPKGLAYAKGFNVDLGDDSEIDSVVLSRLPAQTHTMAADARTIDLTFRQSGRGLRVGAPPSGITAPPGPYYLFVNKKTAKGPVPSMARIVFLGGGANDAEAYQPVPNGHKTNVDDVTVPNVALDGGTPPDVTDGEENAPGFPAGSRQRTRNGLMGIGAALALVGAGLALGMVRRRRESIPE